MNTGKIKLIVLVGPSGVGKTEIAIEIAQYLKAEIVSADAALIYKGMDIGTAKPSISQRKLVPHHLIDLIALDQIYSVAEFQQDAQAAITDIHQRGVVPLLVGGTGQYIRAVVDGWAIPKVAADPKLRVVLEQWLSQIGFQELHQRLRFLDIRAAEKIDPRNSRRTIRALEVIFNTGYRFSEQKKLVESNFNSLIFGLQRSREELYKRVDYRIEKMISDGLLNEVENLLKQGYSIDLPAFKTIGYREIISCIQGEYTLEDAKQIMRKRTRILIRHQANWFKKNDSRINWYQIDNNVQELIVADILKWYYGA